jgi:hypothetical protein
MYIQSILQEGRILLIAGGRLGSKLVPRVHQLGQISSVYVSCMDKANGEWTKQFSKVSEAFHICDIHRIGFIVNFTRFAV